MSAPDSIPAIVAPAAAEPAAISAAPPEPAPVDGRTYGGQSAAARRDGRRRRLIDAGLELYSTDGYAATPVKAVCRHARLTERSFYEHFEDREALLYAVCDAIAIEINAVVAPAVLAAPKDVESRLRAGLEAYFGALAADPRKVRLLFVESVGVSASMEARRVEAMRAAADLISHQAKQLWGELPPGVHPRLVGIGLVGATVELAREAFIGEHPYDPAVVVEHAVAMFTSAAGRPLAG